MKENTPPAPDEFPATLLGRYEPLLVLGRGGMGVVWKARDRELARDVAIKLLKHGKPELRLDQRFAREAAGLVRVRHPHVVAVYDHGPLDDGSYLVLELIEGTRLDLARGLVPPLDAMLQVASGLDAVHRAGLLHRDVKPANVIWTPGRGAVLVDFGLVMDPERTRLTRKEAAVGTILFLAPEVVVSGSYSPATDLYAWGVSLFLLLERRIPYELPTLTLAWKERALPDPPFQVLDPEGPEATLIRRCLAWDPTSRPAGRAGLDAVLKGALSAPTRALQVPGVTPSAPPTDRPGTRRGALVAGALIGLAGLAAGLSRSPPDPEPPLPTEPIRAGEPAVPDLEAVRAELAMARDRTLDRFLTPGGPSGSADPTEERRPLLAPDPARWGAVVRALPSLRRFHAWIGGGGRPEALAEAERSRLRTLDAEFVAEGLPEPFWPYAYLEPAAGPGPVPVRFMAVPEWRGLLGEAPVSGWLRVGLEQLDQAARLAEDLDQTLAAGFGNETPPPGFPPALWSRRAGMPHGSVWELARAVSGDIALRTGLRGVLRPGGRALHAALYALARAMEDEPARREAIALLLIRPSQRVSTFWYDAFAQLEPETILGGRPGSPAAGLLHGWFAKLRATVATRMGLPTAGTGNGPAGFVAGAGEPAQPRSDPAAALAWERADTAWSFVLEARVRAPDLDPDKLVAEAAARLDAVAPGVAAWACLDLGQVIAARLGPARLPEALRSRLRVLAVRLPEASRAEAERLAAGR